LPLFEFNFLLGQAFGRIALELGHLVICVLPQNELTVEVEGDFPFRCLFVTGITFAALPKPQIAQIQNKERL